MERSNKQKNLHSINKIRDYVSDIEKLMNRNTEKHKRQGITLADKVMMLRERGLTQMEIAKEIGASQARVSNILGSFKEWKETTQCRSKE